MSQITPVPGPSQADFDALNGKVTNLDLITGQTAGIKSIALDATKCPVGSIRWFDLRNTATADIPTNAQYGIARVNKRNATAITITIYDEFGNIYYCTYGGTWDAWKKVTMTTA